MMPMPKTVILMGQSLVDLLSVFQLRFGFAPKLLIANPFEVFEVALLSVKIRQGGIIFSDGSVFFPRTKRHLGFFHKAPVNFAGVGNTEVVSDSWRNIDPGTLIFSIDGPAIAENVAPVIDFKRTNIFPLSVARSIVGVDLQPSAFQSRALIMFWDPMKPWDDLTRFRSITILLFVIVG